MADTDPEFYDGMAELIAEFRARGGKVAVVTHSPAARIRPDLVLGWDSDPARRKPSAWPAQHALEELGVSAAEAVVVDDLSPGVKMARAAGIAVGAAGWGHSVPVIEASMRRECDHYFRTVDDLAALLLGD